MKIIDGEIRKIESKLNSNIFFDFEFVGESDEDTYGLFCFVQRSNPKNIFIIEMNDKECEISKNTLLVDAVKKRAVVQTGVTDLIILKILRFEEKKIDVKMGFQAFLKDFAKPIAVYEDIFKPFEEAFQVNVISVTQFENLGGKVHLLGDLTFS